MCQYLILPLSYHLNQNAENGNILFIIILQNPRQKITYPLKIWNPFTCLDYPWSNASYHEIPSLTSLAYKPMKIHRTRSIVLNDVIYEPEVALHHERFRMLCYWAVILTRCDWSGCKDIGEFLHTRAEKKFRAQSEVLFWHGICTALTVF